MLTNTRADILKKLRYFATPSWLSGIIAVLLPLMTIIDSGITAHFKQVYVYPVGFLINHDTTGIFNKYNLIVKHLSHNQILNSLYLYLFWIIVGIIVYFLTNKVVSYFKHAVAIEKELFYMNTNRKTLLGSVLRIFEIRIIALIIIWILAAISLHDIVPYLFRDGQNIFKTLNVMNAINLLLYFLLQVLVIFAIDMAFRLFFLKPRLFR